MLKLLQKETERGFYCTTKYLSYRLGISEGSIAGNIAELIKQGLVERISVLDYFDKEPHKKAFEIGMEHDKLSANFMINKGGATLRRFVGYRALSENELSSKLMNFGKKGMVGWLRWGRPRTSQKNIGVPQGAIIKDRVHIGGAP